MIAFTGRGLEAIFFQFAEWINLKCVVLRLTGMEGQNKIIVNGIKMNTALSYIISTGSTLFKLDNNKSYVGRMIKNP